MYNFIDLFIYLKERQKDILSLLVHSMNDHNNQSGATAKSETWHYIWISRTDGKDPDTWTIIYSLLGCMSRKLDWKKGSPKAQPGTPI